MQSDYKEICKITSQRTGKSEQLYKDLANFVFASLYKNMRRPKNLIIKLRGIGFWYLRKKRMIGHLEFPPDYNKKKEDFKHELAWVKNENRKEMHAIFRERLKEYEEYSEEKRKINAIRHKTQTLIVKDVNSKTD